MTSTNPYAPPAEIENLPARVSWLRVTSCYGGFGLIPAIACAVLSRISKGEGAVFGFVALVTLPIALRLATWSCFRMRWRETPWFVGLFVAVPASCLLVSGFAWVVLLAFPALKLDMKTEFWAWSCFGTAIAVAVDLTVANQLHQRSSIRDVVMAAAVGFISIVAIAIASPLFEPLLNVFRPPYYKFYSGPDLGILAVANLTWIIAVMVNTGIAVLRRARKATKDDQNPQPV